MPFQRVAKTQTNWSYLKQYTRLCVEQGAEYDGKRYKGECTLRPETTQAIQETDRG
jgi:outer membrane cobalamin receptor